MMTFNDVAYGHVHRRYFQCPPPPSTNLLPSLPLFFSFFLHSFPCTIAGQVLTSETAR